MTGTELATRGMEASIATATGLGLPQAPMKPWMMRIEEHPSWEILSQIPMTMWAGVSLKQFRVKDLLGLREGQVFECASLETDDVPVKVGQTQLGWSEFEVVDQRMAVRITRLS